MKPKSRGLSFKYSLNRVSLAYSAVAASRRLHHKLARLTNGLSSQTEKPLSNEASWFQIPVVISWKIVVDETRKLRRPPTEPKMIMT